MNIQFVVPFTGVMIDTMQYLGLEEFHQLGLPLTEAPLLSVPLLEVQKGMVLPAREIDSLKVSFTADRKTIWNL